MTSSKYNCRQPVWVITQQNNVLSGTIQSVRKSQTYDNKNWCSENGFTEYEEYDILLESGELARNVCLNDCMFDNKNEASLFLIDRLKNKQ